MPRPAARARRPVPNPQTAFRLRVHEVVRAIPAGRVMTYGAIASLIPPPPGIDWAGYQRIRARWVGYAMAACPEDVPWHRVVNARGRISQRPDHGPLAQRALLAQEGIRFSPSGRLDLNQLEWVPDPDWRRDRGLL